MKAASLRHGRSLFVHASQIAIAFRPL